MENINTIFSNAAIGTKPEILHTIHLQEKNIAIYQRDITHLRNDLKTCMQTHVEFRKSGSLADIQTALESEMGNYKALVADIVALLQLFGKVAQSQTFKVFLATVNTNMCRKFHTDINDLRLLCSYAGQGTLWLPEEAINRKALDGLGNNQDIVKEEALIQQVQTGEVCLLKGAIYPKKGTKAVVHRSPTIEEIGEKRLLLRIDTNEFLVYENL
ncbi:MAG: DUF1826 domain-containing protein [Saprospiraceae bacterium]|nr:DUF1826 domain-containing protein [Saprospiraceae bacterium]